LGSKQIGGDNPKKGGELSEKKQGEEKYDWKKRRLGGEKKGGEKAHRVEKDSLPRKET